MDGLRAKLSQSTPESMNDRDERDIVEPLATKDLLAIAVGLREMYESYVAEEPPERISRLMRWIERLETVP
jgi:hypothetical protein